MSAYPVIQLILPDRVLEFSGEEILEANLVEEQDPTSTELPISVIEFKIMQYDESFSMFDGEIYAQLSERIKAIAYKNIDGSNYLLGEFYLDEWENVSESQFQFRVVDIVGVMEKTDFDGIFFSAATRAEDIFSAVLGPANIAYTLHDDLKDVERSGWIAPGNYREALQQICFSIGACISTARRNDLYIKPMGMPEDAIESLAFTQIGNDVKLMDQSINLLKSVSSIELVTHTYTQQSELTTVFQETLPAGNHKIVFEKPMYNIVVDGPGYAQFVLGTEGSDYLVTENSDYLEVGGEYNFDPNSLWLTLSESGLVTITGYEWLDNMRSFYYYNPAAVEASNKITLKISDATLVGPDQAEEILVRLSAYYAQRYEKSIKVLPAELKNGDTILVDTIYNKKVLANIEKISSNLIGFLTDVSAVGIQVETIYARYPRTGIAGCGVGMTRNNKFRESTLTEVRSV